MTVINTNVGALQARTYAVRADGNVTKAMERLSSGLRINSAADDAAGLAVANKMESQVRGMNMAIRNSQDGISLVQTAEAAMGEINNMVIRMRELAVQMNNGVYTDADRSNAQLEVTALLQEIDKVADNSAFNQVKILNGTYSQNIRAGNTNPEVIGVTIDRMNTDTLGGGRVTAGDVNATVGSPAVFKAANTVLSGTEGRTTISKDELSDEINAFATANSGGTWSIKPNSSDQSSKFVINATSGAIDLNSANTPELNFNETDPSANVYKFAVEYKSGSVTVTDNVTLNITDRPVLTTNTTLTSAMAVEEGDCIKIFSVDTNDNGNAREGVFSDAFQEFVAANGGPANVTFSMGGGTDDGAFTLNTATGALTSNLDFERPVDLGTGTSTANDNVYDISVRAAAVNSAGATITITENISLTVEDDHNAQGVANEDSAILPTNSTAAVAGAGGHVIGIDALVTLTKGANTTIDTHAVFDAAFAGSNPFAVFETEFDDGGAGSSFKLFDKAGVEVGQAAYSGPAGIAINAATGVLTVTDANTVAGTYEDLKIVFRSNTADGTDETFSFDFDLQVNAGSAAAVAVTGAKQSGEHHTIAVQAGGEAMTIDLKNDSDDSTTTDTIFNGIGEFYQADPCGTFTMVAGTRSFNGDDSHSDAGKISVSADGVVTLAAGAPAGTYALEVQYENNEGEHYTERLTITSTDVGEAPGEDRARATALASAAATNTSSVQVAGTSNLSVVEARQGNIVSTGAGAVLSSAFNSFTTSFTGGTYSVTGTDAALFNINSSTGALETKGLVDFETKNSYDITVGYTSGSNTYSEEVKLTVLNNNVDDGSHIANVDLGTQNGAATAVGILDTAINQITESQAKLGAIQNRLQYNIDNLSKASMLTTTAKGRIMDADFASETSELSKQQILSQAATSMLAQANQSKQSVLALLQ